MQSRSHKTRANLEASLPSQCFVTFFLPALRHVPLSPPYFAGPLTLARSVISNRQQGCRLSFPKREAGRVHTFQMRGSKSGSGPPGRACSEEFQSCKAVPLRFSYPKIPDFKILF